MGVESVLVEKQVVLDEHEPRPGRRIQVVCEQLVRVNDAEVFRLRHGATVRARSRSRTVATSPHTMVRRLRTVVNFSPKLTTVTPPTDHCGACSRGSSGLLSQLTTLQRLLHRLDPLTSWISDVLRSYTYDGPPNVTKPTSSVNILLKLLRVECMMPAFVLDSHTLEFVRHIDARHKLAVAVVNVQIYLWVWQSGVEQLDSCFGLHDGFSAFADEFYSFAREW